MRYLRRLVGSINLIAVLGRNRIMLPSTNVRYVIRIYLLIDWRMQSFRAFGVCTCRAQYLGYVGTFCELVDTTKTERRKGERKPDLCTCLAQTEVMKKQKKHTHTRQKVSYQARISLVGENERSFVNITESMVPRVLGCKSHTWGDGS